MTAAPRLAMFSAALMSAFILLSKAIWFMALQAALLYGIGEIYKIVTDTAIGSDGFSFILNSSGNVILSAKKEGIFSANEDGVDLRKDTNGTLAEAARLMTPGETVIWHMHQ